MFNQKLRRSTFSLFCFQEVKYPSEKFLFCNESKIVKNALCSRLIAGKLVAAHSVAQRATTSFHDEPCPAHGIYKQQSGFKYDRQTSSGHRLFLPTVSN